MRSLFLFLLVVLVGAAKLGEAKPPAAQSTFSLEQDVTALMPFEVEDVRLRILTVFHKDGSAKLFSGLPKRKALGGKASWHLLGKTLVVERFLRKQQRDSAYPIESQNGWILINHDAPCRFRNVRTKRPLKDKLDKRFPNKQRNCSMYQKRPNGNPYFLLNIPG